MTYERLKSVYTATKLLISRYRLLSIVIAVVICLFVGGGIYAYNRSQADTSAQEATTQPTHTADSKKEGASQTQKDTKQPAADSTPPTDATQGEINKPQTPTAGPSSVKQPRRKADSTNPEWVACIEVQNQQYIAYQEENKSVNSEKSAVLAELDRMYNAGELAYDEEDGTYYEPYEQYNIWQLSRTILVQEYDAQLMTVYTNYEAKQTSQQALCEATYDH